MQSKDIVESKEELRKKIETEEPNNIIDQIRNKHEFKENFDFYTWLFEFKNWSEIYQESDDPTIRSSNKKNIQKNIKNIAAVIELDEYGPDKMQRDLTDRLEHLQTIDKCLSIRRGRPKKSYHIRCANLLVMMYKEGVSQSPHCSLNPYKEEECQYSGDFYDFMVKMLPVLQCIGVRLDKVKLATLAKYAAILIPQRREDKPFHHETSYISL